MDARSNGNMSPLFHAIEQGDLDIASMLVDRGADLHVVTSLGSLMSLACQGKYDSTAAADEFTRGDVFKFLRARGLSLDDPKTFDLQDKTIKDSGGWSLLHIAAQSANLGVVKLLLGEKVLVSPVFDGKTPLDFALDGGHDEVAQVLQAAGARRGI